MYFSVLPRSRRLVSHNGRPGALAPGGPQGPDGGDGCSHTGMCCQLILGKQIPAALQWHRPGLETVQTGGWRRGESLQFHVYCDCTVILAVMLKQHFPLRSSFWLKSGSDVWQMLFDFILWSQLELELFADKITHVTKIWSGSLVGLDSNFIHSNQD